LGYYGLECVALPCHVDSPVTIADAMQDFPAATLFMGYVYGSIDEMYRERIDDHRLFEVVDHVRIRLFPSEEVDVIKVS